MARQIGWGWRIWTFTRSFRERCATITLIPNKRYYGRTRFGYQFPTILSGGFPPDWIYFGKIFYTLKNKLQLFIHFIKVVWTRLFSSTHYTYFVSLIFHKNGGAKGSRTLIPSLPAICPTVERWPHVSGACPPSCSTSPLGEELPTSLYTRLPVLYRGRILIGLRYLFTTWAIG